MSLSCFEFSIRLMEAFVVGLSRISSFFPLVNGNNGGVVGKLLAWGARGPGFDSRSRRYDFRNFLSPASKTRYGSNIAKATLIFKGVGEGGGGGTCLPTFKSGGGGHKWVCAPHFWAEQMF